jgi:hypothetical protein
MAKTKRVCSLCSWSTFLVGSEAFVVCASIKSRRDTFITLWCCCAEEETHARGAGPGPSQEGGAAQLCLLEGQARGASVHTALS